MWDIVDRAFLLISCVFMQMSVNDSSPLYLLNDNYLGIVGCTKNPTINMARRIRITGEVKNGRNKNWCSTFASPAK